MAKIGDILISENVITEEQLQKALTEQQNSGDRIGDVLINLGYATKDQIESAFSK